MAKVSIPYHKPPLEGQASTSNDLLGRPMLFQVTRVGSLEPLWPYALALHVNPSSLQEQFTKSKNVVMTRGGFVEFVWPDDLDTLSADATTGAFIGPDSGLTSDSANPKYAMHGRGANSVRSFRGRHGTIAWERHTDLIELFRSNGQIFNGYGAPILRSQIMCMYDRGVFFGWFTTFEVTESGDMPFQFKISWEFKITKSVYKFPIMSIWSIDTVPTVNANTGAKTEEKDTPVDLGTTDLGDMEKWTESKTIEPEQVSALNASPIKK